MLSGKGQTAYPNYFGDLLVVLGNYLGRIDRGEVKAHPGDLREASYFLESAPRFNHAGIRGEVLRCRALFVRAGVSDRELEKILGSSESNESHVPLRAA